MSKKDKPTQLKYIGGGSVMGVPARDLTAEEFAELPKELQEKVLISGFYTVEKAEE